MMSVVRTRTQTIRTFSPRCPHSSASSGRCRLTAHKSACRTQTVQVFMVRFEVFGGISDIGGSGNISDMKMKCFTTAAIKPDDAATCGSPTWIGKGLTCVCFKRKGNYERICINLTPLQEERLKRLKHRMKVYFDTSRPDHQEALRALWSATYPDRELDSLVSDQWKEMGWQGRDPSTDFRGAGFISLENLLFFAKTFSTSFQRLLKKLGGERSAWEYPFAVAGVNVTFMIMKMLDLEASKPRNFVRSVFLQMLSENEWAFDLLYCVAFVVMDKQWLERNATYMEFNDVLKSTRAQVERELLMDNVLRIEDMPSYTLLC